MQRRLARFAVVVVVGALLITSCGGGTGGDGGSESATVAAAASLTDAFDEIISAFETAHPGTSIEVTYDSSGTLAEQIRRKAPIDVFASADRKHMNTVEDAGMVVGKPKVFARNQMAIVTKPGNPTKIATLADLAALDVVSLCNLDAPCGFLSAQMLEASGVTIPESTITRGQNVRSTLRAVTDGDAPAGIVYVTDASVAGDAVTTVEIPTKDNVVTEYPIAAVEHGAKNSTAKDFVAFVSGPEAQAILARHGFLPPT